MAEDSKKRQLNDLSSGADSVITDDVSSDIELYSKEVLESLIEDNLPPTPNNFSLYFDRLLEYKAENLRKQIASILELEENNDDETTILLEQNLKHGFATVKNILAISAGLYKNISLMGKILDKRKHDLEKKQNSETLLITMKALDEDIKKLSTILAKQSTKIKTLYDETAQIIKNVENETIFDNAFGVYNKRYIMTKIEQEIGLVKEFNHKSSFITIELSRELKKSISNEKAILLMTRTIARLLLKSSRRSDVVAHYGNGKFAMLLKHTDIESAKKASERLCDLVSNSNFFLADREIQLKIAIGITDIDTNHTAEEIVVSALDAMDMAYGDRDKDYAVSLRDENIEDVEADEK